MNTLNLSTTHPVRFIGSLLHLAFWFGVLCLLLGLLITFEPSFERDWFTFTGALLLSGLFIPRWSYRVASILLVAFCIFAAIFAHNRGIEYRQSLQQRGVSTPSP